MDEKKEYKQYYEQRELVAQVGITKEAGYLYFVDADGDISRAKMNRGGKKKKRGGLLGI